MPANAANRLLGFYQQNARRLPWRALPGEKRTDPYRVWLSEIMLQQTTVAAVIPRYQRFLDRWPSVEELAAAPDSDVLSEWAGLGYYARARNLVACAREVVDRGGFPDTEEELRSLPGIGPYTAAAIAAIAFGRQAAPVDTNVKRVIARLHGLSQPDHVRIAALLTEMTPPGRSGDLVQAMMDLGSSICRPAAPQCHACPLAADCAAFADGDPVSFPGPEAKRVRPVRYGIAFWCEHDGSVWLVRRPAKGLLGGMAALPGTAWTDDPPPARPAVAQVRHVFTHFALELSIAEGPAPDSAGWWHPIDRLDEAGLPTLYRKAADLILAARDERRSAA